MVLKDINVTYEPGKCNMIIGASGSGKTVLLKNLIGLMEPDSGEICYGEKRFTTMSYEEKKALRQNIGVLFQGSALFDFATVIENVMFPMEFFTDWSKAKCFGRGTATLFSTQTARSCATSSAPTHLHATSSKERSDRSNSSNE